MRICCIAVFAFGVFFSPLGLKPLSSSSLAGEEIEATWLKVPFGFKVTHFASDELATNIYSMTTDRLGRIVVAGPGYIKILLDQDGDGKAESAKLFSKLPGNGAMGMCFDGTDLFCVGDQGILKFQDRNKDDVADGPPSVIYKLKTGGEHDSHSLQKGPDGWWYLISGNYSGVGANIISSSRSPVQNPVAGVLTRISPDFKTREVIADGMRNSYDFAFDNQGDIFVYDSDGERDVSLPWYQPTRVFRLHPGAHAGWVTRSWKRPDYFLDMPTVAARLGRGSPTGISCYQHYQFPAKYQNAIFALDWTFGRVVVVRKQTSKSKGATFEHELFVSGKGTHGFAPTDSCIGVDGSLYVSVGGRSTQGSVYRIRHVENAKTMGKISVPVSVVDCLDLPQPLSAWSRYLSQPYAKNIAREKLEAAIFNDSLALRHRVRAVELVISAFGALSPEALAKIGDIKSSELQARLAWAVCQKPLNQIESSLLFHFLNHQDNGVKISALEALTGNRNVPSYLAKPIAECLASQNLHLRKAAAAFISASRMNPYDYLKKSDQPPSKAIAYWFGIQSRRKVLNQSLIGEVVSGLENESNSVSQLEFMRLLQLAMGDLGEKQGLPQVFESYETRFNLPTEFANPLRSKLKELIGTKDENLNWEAIRCLAVGKLVDPSIAATLLEQVTESSTPQFDIHVLAAIGQGRPDLATQARRIASVILNVQAKIDRLELNQDRNWEPRFKEVVRRLTQIEKTVAVEIANEGITRSGQMFLFDFIDSDKKLQAIDRYIKTQLESDDFQMDSQTIRLLGSTSNPEHWQIIRDSFDSSNVRDTIIELLNRKPYQGDRAKFVAGLASAQIKTVRIAAQALMRLPQSKDPEEQVALLRAIQRISPDKEGYSAREWLIRTLQRNMERSFGFVFGTAGFKPQVTVVERWQKFLTDEFPTAVKKLKFNGKFNVAEFEAKMFDVDWESGDATRGAKLYSTLSCVKCHGSRNRLGPDLAGVTRRFSKQDLFRAIADPSYQVPSRYQTTLFETDDGKYHSGIIIYDSVDGVLLRDSNNKTVRIDQDRIVKRQQIARSLMPENILDELDSQGIADLYEYLKSL